MIQIYIMDNDYEVLKELESFVNLTPNCHAKCYTNSQGLVDAVRREPPDAVLIDFDTPSSFSAVEIMKDVSPNTKLILMSEDKCKTMTLYELGLDGFLLKPPEKEKVSEQLFRLRHPLLAIFKPTKKECEAK